MPATSHTRETNRRALILFIVMMVVIIITVEIVVFVFQRHHLTRNAQKEIREQLELVGQLVADSLLRSDYATVDSILGRWAGMNSDVAHITAKMPNGFVLADIERPHAEAKTVATEHVVQFGENQTVHLRAEIDLTRRQHQFLTIVLYASTITVSSIVLLGWVMWWTLKRTAIKPLEAQLREREQRELDLMRRSAELQVALGELESFSYSVSHDLRGPLRAIDGYTHMISEDDGRALSDEGRANLARARAAAQRMGNLIDDLLKLARMSRVKMTHVPVDLGKMARDCTESLEREYPARNVSVTIAEVPTARGDPGLLAAALENLLENAWKYTSRTPNARIEFNAQHDEHGRPVYYVRDNGAGFDMKYVDHLFQPFQRLHGTEFPGSGIGLATVARIVRRHGGRVWAEGDPGQGATFYFTLGTPPETA